MWSSGKAVIHYAVYMISNPKSDKSFLSVLIGKKSVELAFYYRFVVAVCKHPASIFA